MIGAFVATERLRTIVKAIYGSSKKFAQEFNIDEPRACRILNGKEEPSKQFMKAIHLRFGVQENLFFFSSVHEVIDGNIIIPINKGGINERTEIKKS